MNKILVTSTSFLNHRHKSWQQLFLDSEIEFSNYGDLQSIITPCNLQKKVICVFFADDIYDSFTGSRSDEDISTYLENLLLLIEKRCRESSSLFIFCYSFHEEYNPIRDAKKISAKQASRENFTRSLIKLKDQYEFLFTIDIEKCVASIGTLRAFDQRNWYFAKSRLTNEGLSNLIDSVHLIMRRYKIAPHKVLVLDCDNTLWGGVIGEDGIDSIAIGTDGIGKAFADFQKVILRLKNEGILLALSSKNNVDEVWKVFAEHEGMVLQQSDIVIAKINWNEKSHNILNMANELDLNVNSFVFWDDSPIEREKTRLAIPEMLTVEVSDNVHDWPSLLESLFELSRFFTTEEDRNKTAQYEARHKFIESQNQALNEQSFLKTLNLKGELIKLTDGNIARAVQLCQKTNQFNLTTRRFSGEDLKKFNANTPEFCMLARLKDRFSDHGIVALFCLREFDNKTILIENILLSCRVLGRQFEFWIMSRIIDVASSNGYTRILALFIDSGRNTVAKEYLTDCNFKRIEIDNAMIDKLADSYQSGMEVFSRGINNLENFIWDAYES